MKLTEFWSFGKLNVIRNSVCLPRAISSHKYRMAYNETLRNHKPISIENRAWEQYKGRESTPALDALMPSYQRGKTMAT